ncbi:LytTR family DNA-binding domain-containing protein [Piscinibacter gummiphilus]|uniref:LytTR family DNA-binding domain-containing protein n=1 Tax=Piscinibacter gummiphilus TaxID=946333 RepID=A0ABZ0D4H0_9BURK|nr:LytTR family DNA-binding domain-containing protein [Piscinibacter gummiphilus]WOB10215.1 LytTR family DNA-binding domain-containing protein [Piscinibacter gummiphilus]
MMTAIVVDDEPLARRALATMIERSDRVRLVAQAADGAAALPLVEELQPDLLFLDIEMPEMDGLTVLRTLRSAASPPLPILTTAYDQHAIAAFELHALDYLLKPFGQTRFDEAVRRAADLLDLRERAAAVERAQSALGATGVPRLERVFVRDARSIRPVPVADVLRVEAQSDYAALHVGQRVHLVDMRITDLAARLPSPPFLRVHRSHIVNLDHVDRIELGDDTRMTVLMNDGGRVPVSRSRASEIRNFAR